MNTLNYCDSLSSGFIDSKNHLIGFGCFSGYLCIKGLTANFLLKAERKGNSPIRFLQLSSNGDLVVYLQGNTLYAMQLGKSQNFALEQNFPVSTLSVSNSLNFIGVGYKNGKVIIYKPYSNIYFEINDHNRPIKAITFRINDERVCSISEDGKVSIWDIKAECRLFHNKINTKSIKSVLFSGDRKIIVCSHAGKLQIIELPSLKISQEFNIPAKEVNSMRLSPKKDMIVWITSDRTLKGLKINNFASFITVNKTGAFKKRKYWNQGIVTFNFSLDGKKILTMQRNGSIYSWTIYNDEFTFDECISPRIHHLIPIPIVSPSVLAISTDGTSIKFWDLEVEKNFLNIRLKNPPKAFVFGSKRFYIYVGCNDGSVNCVNLKSPKIKKKLYMHNTAITCIEINSKMNILATSSSDGNVKIWNLVRNKLDLSFLNHLDTVRDLCFSYDGSLLASASFDNTIRIWNLETGTCIHELEGHTAPILSVAFGLSNDIIASGSGDKTIRIWKIFNDGKHKSISLKGHDGPVLGLIINAYRTELVSFSYDKTVRMWSLSNDRSKDKILKHPAPVLSVSLNSEKNQILTGSDDGFLRMWDISTGDLIKSYYIGQSVRKMRIVEN